MIEDLRIKVDADCEEAVNDLEQLNDKLMRINFQMERFCFLIDKCSNLLHLFSEELKKLTII